MEGTGRRGKEGRQGKEGGERDEGKGRVRRPKAATVIWESKKIMCTQHKFGGSVKFQESAHQIITSCDSGTG